MVCAGDLVPSVVDRALSSELNLAVPTKPPVLVLPTHRPDKFPPTSGFWTAMPAGAEVTGKLNAFTLQIPALQPRADGRGLA